MTDYAAELQRTTIYADEVIETKMAQLLAMGHTVVQTRQTTFQASNLAIVMVNDLKTAVRAITNFFNGNTGMISRYVKRLDETIIKSGDLNKIIVMLNERIVGQAIAMEQTVAGQIAMMSKALGDLTENTELYLSNVLSSLIKALSNIVEQLNKISLESTGIIDFIETLTTALITLKLTGLIPL